MKEIDGGHYVQYVQRATRSTVVMDTEQSFEHYPFSSVARLVRVNRMLWRSASIRHSRQGRIVTGQCAVYKSTIKATATIIGRRLHEGKWQEPRYKTTCKCSNNRWKELFGQQENIKTHLYH